jgi:hypothetical protein
MSNERNTMNIKDGTYRAESDGTGGIKIDTTVHMGKGYWVAEYGCVTINGAITKSALADAIKILDIEIGEYVGVWTDTKDNVTYIDRSHHFLKRQTAFDLAKHWEQIAVWDCANREEVRVA